MRFLPHKRRRHTTNMPRMEHLVSRLPRLCHCCDLGRTSQTRFVSFVLIWQQRISRSLHVAWRCAGSYGSGNDSIITRYITHARPKLDLNSTTFLTTNQPGHNSTGHCHQPARMSATIQTFPNGPLSIERMTIKEAYDGLYLELNFELADQLEAWIKGSMSATKTVGFDFDIDACAKEAVKEYRPHRSWAGHDYPWQNLPAPWILAAMSKIVHHVLGGNSIADLGLRNETALDDMENATVSGLRPSIEDDGVDVNVMDDEDEGEASLQDDARDAAVFHNNASRSAGGNSLFANMRGRQDRRTPHASSGSPPSLAARAGSTESPTLRAARVRQNAASNSDSKISSSSPLPSLPSSRKGKGEGEGKASSAAAEPPSLADHPLCHETHAATATARPETVNKSAQKKSTPGRGRTIKTDADTGEEYVAWFFERILDSRWAAGGKNGTASNSDGMLEYKVKWRHSKATWQPSSDMQDNPDDIAKFHEKYPEKPGPPGWFLRARGEEV